MKDNLTKNQMKNLSIEIDQRYDRNKKLSENVFKTTFMNMFTLCKS